MKSKVTETEKKRANGDFVYHGSCYQNGANSNLFNVCYLLTIVAISIRSVLLRLCFQIC